jgi:hypothetical protein
MRRLPSSLTTILAMAALPLAAVAMLSNQVRAQFAQPTPEVIEGPTEWVAFQAMVRVSHPGAPVIQGRYFRSASGSERLETGPSLSDVRVVSISNVAQGVAYHGRPRLNQWTRVPGAPVPGARPPLAYRTSKWTLHPYRLALRKGQDGTLNAHEGFTAYSVRHESGGTSMKVPDLNFFDAVRQRPDGRYEIYSEIERTEPDAQLFEPPAGAIVTESEVPRPGDLGHAR